MPAARRSGLAPRRSRSRARDVADDVSSTTRRPTTHPYRRRQVRAARAGSRWLHGSVAHELIRQAGDISVHVIAGDAARASRRSARRCDTRAPARPRSIRGPMLGSLGIVAAALGVGARAPAISRVSEHRAGFSDGGAGAAPSPMACGRRCSPAWSACSPTISSSCRRSTPSRSPIPRTSSRCSSSRSWRSSPAT